MKPPKRVTVVSGRGVGFATPDLEPGGLRFVNVVTAGAGAHAGEVVKIHNGYPPAVALRIGLQLVSIAAFTMLRNLWVRVVRR